MKRPALGKGLDSLIPQKKTYTQQAIPGAITQVLQIPVDDITENPRQPRRHFSPSDLEDLIGSIKEHGIIQPLVVTHENGEYILIAGERRLRASRTLGLPTVPAIVREADEQQKLELALIENIQRQDLNPVEEAIAYKALIDEFGVSHDDVSKRVGKARSTVSNTIRLLDLSEEILKALSEGRIQKTHARTLLGEPDLQKRDMLFHQILEGKMTKDEVEARVYKKPSKPRKGVKDPNIVAHEKYLREVLGTKVQIKENGGKGKIIIQFFSKEELLRVLDELTD